MLFVFSLVLSSWAIASPADAVVGDWITPESKSRVNIYKCGSHLCGRIVWLKEPLFEPGHVMAGQAKVDDKNPDVSKRQRPIQGLEFMNGFRFDGDNVWEDGTIYDPESGKTYSCKMTLEDDNTLKVRGYIGFSFIGRTSIWTR